VNNITVIGIGKLGICNALIFEKAGYSVLGIDLSEEYCNSLNIKEQIFEEPYVNEYLQSSENFSASTSLQEGLDFSDLIFIVIDTPNGLDENHYDHSKLINLLKNINQKGIKNKHLIISCTVMPGFINGIGKPLLSNCKNVTLNYNPEFIAQGDIIRTFENPDMVLIGEENQEVGDSLEKLYRRVCKNKPTFCRVPPLEAEISKIAVNGFITMKLSYANMIGDICDRVGADKSTVLRSVGADTRIGNKYLKPGYSFGGPCFPRDTKALSKLAVKNGILPLMSEAAGDYNDLHVRYMAEELLSQNLNTYVFEDVCFKENCPVAIIEESAKLKMANILVKDHGKKVIIKDRDKVIKLVKEEFGNLFEYQIKQVDDSN